MNLICLPSQHATRQVIVLCKILVESDAQHIILMHARHYTLFVCQIYIPNQFEHIIFTSSFSFRYSADQGVRY